jgi:hypothetical protein
MTALKRYSSSSIRRRTYPIAGIVAIERLRDEKVCPQLLSDVRRRRIKLLEQNVRWYITTRDMTMYAHDKNRM